MNTERLIKATRIAAAIILAGFFVIVVLRVFVLTPFTFYPFYLTLFTPVSNATVTPAPVWQIAYYEGNYLWSDRVIDTMSLAVVFVAAGLGAAILLREEPEEKEAEKKGAEY
jgi:hypothetical protein